MILFITLKTFSLTGGIEKACRSLIKAFDELQLPFKVWSMYDEAQQLDGRYTARKNFKGFGGKKLVLALECVMNAFKFETVVLSHINLLLFGKLIKTLKPSTKIILWAHGIEVWRPIPKWKQKFLMERAEIWSVSEYTKQQLIKLHQIPAGQIKVLHNTLDPFMELPSHFEKPAELLNRYAIAADAFTLFTITRISSTEHLKNYDLVIAAVQQLSGQYPQLNYVLAGKADETEKHRLEQLIAEQGLSHKVKLIGFVDEKEISDHYLMADCFILPSKKEGFGIVLIEAAACGCQVIGGNADGSTDALLNGELGQMVNPDDVNAIAQAIEKAIGNKAHQPERQQQLTLENFGFTVYKNKLARLLGQKILD